MVDYVFYNLVIEWSVFLDVFVGIFKKKLGDIIYLKNMLKICLGNILSELDLK